MAQRRQVQKLASGDNKKGFCKFCKCTLSAKLCDIEKHRNTNKHKKAEEPFSAERRTILTFKKLGEAKKVEGTLAMFVAEHCSIRVVDHLSEVCKVCFSDSKAGSELQVKKIKVFWSNMQYSCATFHRKSEK